MSLSSVVLRPLAHRDYRVLLGCNAIMGFVMPLFFLTTVFWVQEEYPGRTVLYNSLVAGSRGLGMLIFSLVGGAIADRFERRRILLACEAGSVSVNGVVAACMVFMPLGEGTVWAVMAGSFLAAGVMSADMPARAASVPAVVGLENLGPALSLNMIAIQLMLPAALPVVGFLNDTFEPGHVYAGGRLAWLAILPLTASLRYQSRGGGVGSGMVANIRDGLRYTFSHVTILGIMLLVVIAQVFGMPAVGGPLGPIWMTEVLGLSRQEFGFMAMTWGLGALVASFAFARLSGLASRGSTLCAMVFLFGAMVLVFGYSRSVPLTATANFVLGFVFVGGMLTSTTLVQHFVAEDFRGRVMGLFPLVMGLAMLNTAPVGATAEAVGLTFVVPAIGWLMLVLGALVVGLRPGLLRTRTHPGGDAPLAAAPLPAG